MVLPINNNDSGYNTPVESILAIHPTAARTDHSINVISDNTIYSQDHITSTFHNRGSSVSINAGQYTITPTVDSFQFRTARKVPKTG